MDEGRLRTIELVLAFAAGASLAVGIERVAVHREERITLPPAQPTAIVTVEVPVAVPTPMNAIPSAAYAPPSSSAAALEERARTVMLDDPQTARQLLLPEAIRGQATESEVRMLKEACTRLHDQTCIDFVKQKYPR